MFVLVYITLCPSTFAIILTRKKKLVSLLLLSTRCIVTENVLCLYLTVAWVGLQIVIVVFPHHKVSEYHQEILTYFLLRNPVYL